MNNEAGTPYRRDLGNELGEFSRNRGLAGSAFQWLRIAAGSVLVAGLGFAAIMLIARPDTLPPDDVDSTIWLTAVFLGIALAVLGSGISAAERRRREGPWRLQVFQHGVRITLKEARREFLWDEVADLVRTDGLDYSFTGLEPGAQLLFQVRFGDSLLGRMQETFSRGEKITLGVVSIDQTGIEGSGGRIPWTEVEYIRVAGAHVEVKQRGKLLRRKIAELKDVKNVFVLPEALRRLAGASVRT